MAEPTITDADREVAAALFRDTRTDLAVKFRLGANPEPLLAAFAAHREASTAALSKRVETLEAALRPFADHPDFHASDDWGVTLLNYGEGDEQPGVTAGDFRRAKAALGGQP